MEPELAREIRELRQIRLLMVPATIMIRLVMAVAAVMVHGDVDGCDHESDCLLYTSPSPRDS